MRLQIVTGGGLFSPAGLRRIDARPFAVSRRRFACRQSKGIEMTRDNTSLCGTCVAFGCFDGMHAGHLAVLDALVRRARAQNRMSLLLSAPAPVPVLTTESEKAVYAQAAGVDRMHTISAPDLPAEAFVREVLRGQYGAACVVLGENLSWNGYTCAAISDAARDCGIEVCRVTPIRADGRPIATEDLHRALDMRDPEAYTRLCGHPYMLLAPVVHGRGLGRTVGMPTANQSSPPGKKLPPEGVYASIARLDGESFMGLTNIGRRPSVDDGDQTTIETNLFDFDRRIYGAQMRLELCFRIRGVRKFAGLREVQAQVQKDIEQSIGRLSEIYHRQA